MRHHSLQHFAILLELESRQLDSESRYSLIYFSAVDNLPKVNWTTNRFEAAMKRSTPGGLSDEVTATSTSLVALYVPSVAVFSGLSCSEVLGQFECKDAPHAPRKKADFVLSLTQLNNKQSN